MPKVRVLTAPERMLLDRLGIVLNQKGLAWADAAKAVGKSANLGNQWSTRRSCPVQRDVYTLARWLDVEMGWLLSGDEPSEQTTARTKTELEMLLTIRDMPEDQQRAAIASVRAMRDILTKR
jgi:hypothetical protein